MTGHLEGPEPCPACVETDNFITPKAEAAAGKINFTKTEIESEEGQKIAEEKNIKKMPYIEDCKTVQTDCTKDETGKESCKVDTKCRVVTGFDEKDWSDLDDLVPENTSDESK